MAWHHSGDKPLSEPMMVSLPMPWWVKGACILGIGFIFTLLEAWDSEMQSLAQLPQSLLVYVNGYVINLTVNAMVDSKSCSWK